MDGHWREWLDLLLRWIHLIAGIMWIGNSMLFNWLDRNLERKDSDPDGFEGRIWMVHSGGFYDVVKRQLAPGEMPERLHWFMWQNLSTWISGILLLVVVYYLGGNGMLVDPRLHDMTPGSAVALGVAAIVGTWVLYEGIFRSPLANRPKLAALLLALLLAGVVLLLTHFLNGRAAYIHFGVIIGTLMTANVWTVILPSQRELVALTKSGRPQLMLLNKRAKQRSIHNNYFTFPLLFIMLSSHFPSTYGNANNWLVLLILCVGSAGVRHWMNERYGAVERTRQRWLVAAVAIGMVSLTTTFLLTQPRPLRSGIDRPVPYTEVSAILGRRCVSCHASNPSDPVWQTAPLGIKLDDAALVKQHALRIRERVFVLKNMPLGNQSGMTEEERALVAAWVEQGATP